MDKNLVGIKTNFDGIQFVLCKYLKDFFIHSTIREIHSLLKRDYEEEIVF